ncbi:MAG: esterase [Acidobacteriaceae bacterium]|nr:esterase [Acidobacteriaceae bacterium]
MIRVSSIIESLWRKIVTQKNTASPSNPEDVLSRTPPAYDARLKYGSDPNQFGDLRLPGSKGKHPLVMMIHGGFWRAKYDLAHAGHLCAGLTRSGIATFNLEYRRVGNPGGGWPGTFEDIISGYRFIHQYAAKNNIDASKSVVMGHSAGGQLALCLAGREPRLAGAVSLAGVVDVKRAWELHLSNNAAEEFMGGSPAQVPEHFHEASPIEIAIPKVQQVLIHGAKDDVVPVDFSREYVRVKKERGEHVKLIEIEDVGHYELIDPESKAWKQVLESVGKLVL